MIPIYNLSNENKQTLKTIFFIDNEDKVLLDKDLNTIIEFRQNLFEVTKQIASLVINNIRNYDLVKGKLNSILKNIAEYVGNFDENSIMRRAMFINNIRFFLYNDVNQAIDNAVAFSDVDDAAERLSNMKEELLNYLQLGCSKKFFENPNFEKCRQKLASKMAESLKEKMKSNYLNLIDEDDLTYSDLYFALGEVINKRNQSKAEFDEFYHSNCDGCGRDDCMSTPSCSFLDEKERLGNKYSKYEDLLDILIKVVDNKDVSQYTVNDAVSRLNKEGKLRKVLEKLLIQKRYAFEDKKVKLPLSLEEVVNINPTDVKIELYKGLSCGHGIINSNPDDIAAFVLLNIFDWGDTRGDIVNKLQTWYEENKSSYDLDAIFNCEGEPINI